MKYVPVAFSQESSHTELLVWQIRLIGNNDYARVSIYVQYFTSYLSSFLWWNKDIYSIIQAINLQGDQQTQSHNFRTEQLFTNTGKFEHFFGTYDVQNN